MIGDMTDTVGFIGLGVMGSALSTHLLAAGFSVTGYDIDPVRLDAHADRGGLVAANPAQAAAGADVVITSLPSVASLNAVVHDPGGLASWTGPPLVVIETSTLPVKAKAAASYTLASRGIALLDCPLSGTGAQAARKDLVAYVSGDDDAKARAAPVLDAFTRGWYDAGEFGNGMKLKMVANLLVIVHNLAAAEALVFAERSGLRLDLVLKAVGDGAGTSRMFEVRGPLMAAGDYDVAGATTEILAKDSAIIADHATVHDIPMPLLSAAAVYYRAALAQGRAHQEAACVHAVLKNMGGLSVDHG
jgi:putative dehydrogenase